MRFFMGIEIDGKITSSEAEITDAEFNRAPDEFLERTAAPALAYIHFQVDENGMA